MLHRLGVEAYLTLANKKSVDILIRKPNSISTVDVKGLAGPYDWPADNMNIFDNPSHFYILLSLEGKITNPAANPSVWIMPSDKIKVFLKTYGARVVASRTLVRKDGSHFRDAWQYFS
ncbi:MAG: hypothetical protein HY667_00295 [Chloroflexi bacterium]|nr:hypothetical protein [Chloroflexota bacterium]